MRLPSDSKFVRWKYIELGMFNPGSGLWRIMANQTKKIPRLFEWTDIEGLRERTGNYGIYSSVFHYDDKDLSKATRLGSLYFDLDHENLLLSRDDTVKLYEYLRQHIPEQAIRVYFTGRKGFHLECEAIALGIGPSNNLPDLFRYIARNLCEELRLNTVDFAVYDLRRMWRIPHSKHELTELYKVPLSFEQLAGTIEEIKEYAKEPHFQDVPEQQFDAKANEWYREWQYKKETPQLSHQDLIERFNKYGQSIVVKDDPDAELVFDPPSLFEGCPAIMEHWETAEKTHDLSHEARLFLCSILSYTEEAEWYLHQILKNCNDYNPEKSQAHINDWKKRRELGIGGRPYTCDRANAVGVGCGSCDLEPKEKLERIGGKLIKTGEFSSPSPYRFAYRRKR